MVGIVSGYFNPLHGGHIDYISEAKKNCDHLIVIVNNDMQANLKYETDKVFMDADHRHKIVSALRDVDEAFISKDIDSTVAGSLIYIKSMYPDSELVFFNSGDRPDPNPHEQEVCRVAGIKNVYLPLKKVFSSRNYRS